MIRLSCKWSLAETITVLNTAQQLSLADFSTRSLYLLWLGLAVNLLSGDRSLSSYYQLLVASSLQPTSSYFFRNLLLCVFKINYYSVSKNSVKEDNMHGDTVIVIIDAHKPTLVYSIFRKIFELYHAKHIGTNNSYRNVNF